MLKIDKNDQDTREKWVRFCSETCTNPLVQPRFLRKIPECVTRTIGLTVTHHQDSRTR